MTAQEIEHKVGELYETLSTKSFILLHDAINGADLIPTKDIKLLNILVTKVKENKSNES